MKPKLQAILIACLLALGLISLSGCTLAAGAAAGYGAAEVADED
jgi:hypothetical protein